MKKIIISESQYAFIRKHLYKKYLREQDEFGPLNYDKLDPCVKDGLKAGRWLGVSFIKKDGSIRHMAFAKKSLSYQRSEREKTEKQLNVAQNNNLIKAFDIIKFAKDKRELVNGGMDPLDAAKKASAGCYRSIPLDRVIAFSCNGQFIDYRDINKIGERFGEEYLSQVPKSQKSQLVTKPEELEKGFELEKELNKSDEKMNKELEKEIAAAENVYNEEERQEELSEMHRRKNKKTIGRPTFSVFSLDRIM